MVTVDQSMGGSGDIDYADFATQMIDARFSGPSGAKAQVSVEPLRGRGGLANNEVAELTYLETRVVLQQLEKQDPDQDVGSTISALGVVGINLPEDTGDAIVFDPFFDGGAGVSVDTSGEGNVDGASVTDNAYLQNIAVEAGMAFDDESTGVGGNFSEGALQFEKYFRETHGRGPVFDQTDDLTINMDVFGRDSVVDVGAVVHLTCYWDVAETTDAGRRFSVPS